jgi:hypothetical protein
MYGPTMRGGMTFRIGVPGAIRAGCAGSRTAEPNDVLLPFIACAWRYEPAPSRRSASPQVTLAGVAGMRALHTFCLVNTYYLPQSAAFVTISTIRVALMTLRNPEIPVRSIATVRSGAVAAQGKRFTGRPAGDHGEADPAVSRALGAWLSRAGSEQDALLALSRARLLVPVVATLHDPGGRRSVPPGDNRTSADRSSLGVPPAGAPQATPHKESEMALPTLIGNDGRPAIIAFTGVDAVRRWRADARPVPVPAARVWQAAGEPQAAKAGPAGGAVVIDVAGPVPFVIEGARLAALAAGQPPPPAHLDPDIRAAIEAAVAAEPSIAGFTLAPGEGPDGPGGDLAVLLRVTGADAAGLVAARRAAQAITASLSPRLRRGIALSVAA